MEWFGITMYGFQDPFKDMMREDYKEPTQPPPVDINDPNKNFVQLISQLDCYVGHADGYAYGSNDRLHRMKRKGITKPVGPNDMYKYPGTMQMIFGWWKDDPFLKGETWFKPAVKTIPSSETTRYVANALKIDKLFRL